MNDGFYTVDGVIYHNKVQALYASVSTGHQVFWHWHDVYDKLDWKSESLYTLDQVYRRRAQQLRDRYDWLILSFSGGADSTNILQTFLKNKIHLDEIFVRWPLKISQGRYRVDANDKSPSNILSEWDLTISPTLEWVRQNHPEILITVYDCSDDILATNFSDDLINETQDQFNFGYWARFASASDTEIKNIEKGRNTCLMFGTDKPQIKVEDNKVYAYFVDILANSNRIMQNDLGRHSELFYWSKDCPEITHTQARAIYHHLCQNLQHAKLLDWRQPFDFARKQSWNDIIKLVIYPGYNKHAFQSNKDLSAFYGAVDHFLISQPEISGAVDSWKSLLKNITDSIGPEFVMRRDDGVVAGLRGFTSQFYYLGDLPVNMLVDQ